MEKKYLRNWQIVEYKNNGHTFREIAEKEHISVRAAWEAYHKTIGTKITCGRIQKNMYIENPVSAVCPKCLKRSLINKDW